MIPLKHLNLVHFSLQIHCQISEHSYTICRYSAVLTYHVLLLINYGIYFMMNTGSDSLIDILLGYPSYEFIASIIVLPCILVHPKEVQKCVRNLYSYHRFRSSLDASYDHATLDDLIRDTDCIICRDTNTEEGSRVMPCGHVFHEDCLKSWIMQKQVGAAGRLERRLVPRATSRCSAATATRPRGPRRMWARGCRRRWSRRR